MQSLVPFTHKCYSNSKPFQRIIDINIKSYVKYPCIFYGILVGIFCFGTHHADSKEAGDGKGSIREPVIFKGG